MKRHKKQPPVLGGFGKGIGGSISLNFSASATANCSTRCRHHPESKAPNATNACYAVVLERRNDRRELLAKLARHELMNPALLCGRAIVEIQKILSKGKRIPWLRISTDGSLPMPGKVRPLFVSQFRALLTLCRDNGIPVHIPIETHNKAEFYRSVIGDLVVIRESLQTDGTHTTTDGAVSFVAGDDIRSGKAIRERRISAARTMAKERTESTGRKCIVCPAVVSGFRAKTARLPANPRAKCGSCTACSLAHIDIVYPMH